MPYLTRPYVSLGPKYVLLHVFAVHLGGRMIYYIVDSHTASRAYGPWYVVSSALVVRRLLDRSDIGIGRARHQQACF